MPRSVPSWVLALLVALSSPGNARQPAPRAVSNGELPVVSPDGKRLAFLSNRGGHQDVFVIAADGTGETQLTNTPEEGGAKSRGRPAAADASDLLSLLQSSDEPVARGHRMAPILGIGNQDMRRTLLLILTASIGAAVACSDRSPTSPEMETSTASPASAEASALTPPGSARHVTVVLPHSDKFVQPGVWGSGSAGLTVTRGSATLDILASTLPDGGCFGSYGEMTEPIPNGPFSLPGTYTQLIGAYPGKVQYAAQYSGLVEGKRMSITITVPSLERALGPFPLTYGVNNAWSPCLYP